MPFLKLLVTISALLTASGNICVGNNEIVEANNDVEQSSDSLKHDSIEDFLSEKQTIVFQKNLDDFSGNEYLLYELSPAGYAIYAIDGDSQAFVEGSKSSNSPYYPFLNYDCYYFGLDNYVYNNGFQYVDIIGDEIVDNLLIESLVTEVPDELFNANNNEDEIDMYSTSFPKNPDPDETDTYLGFTVIKNYEYFSTLKDFPANSLGTCGITALCMFISYLDEYENDGYIPENLESLYKVNNGTNTAFGDYVFENYGHTLAGLGNDDSGYPMANGEIENTFKDYLKGECDTDLYKNTEFHDGCLFYTHTNPRKYINAGHPAIITMTSFVAENYKDEPTKYTYHTAVAYGYNKDDDTFLIHTGWKDGTTKGADIIISDATIYSYNTFLYVG